MEPPRVRLLEEIDFLRQIYLAKETFLGLRKDIPLVFRGWDFEERAVKGDVTLFFDSGLLVWSLLKGNFYKGDL